MKKFVWLTIWVLIWNSCNTYSPVEFPVGLVQDSILIDDQSRSFYLYFPEGIEPHSPLVFVCHGYTGTAEGMIDYTKMNNVADSNGFVVCYPQGTKDQDGNPFWQVGYTFNENILVDDYKFLTHLAQHLQQKYELSQEDTFLTGLSNGGDLCNLFAFHSTASFKAVAPVVGCVMKWMIDSFPKPDPIPILMINGTSDDITLWNGDLEDMGGWGPYYSTPFMQEFWIHNNNCETIERTTLPDLDSLDGSHVILDQYTCDTYPQTPVWIYTVVNGGHDWPGGSGNMDFNASESIWSFFASFIETNEE